jgi:hypothetical protein
MNKVVCLATASMAVVALCLGSAQAETVSYSDTVGYTFTRTFTGTNGQNVFDNILLKSAEMTLPQFDPSLGTLDSVLVTMGVDASTAIYYRIVSSSASISSSAGYVSRYRSPGLISAYANDGNTSDVGPVGTYSGTSSLAYFGSDGGVDPGKDFSFAGASVMPFLGTGQISYFVDTDSFIAINANSSVGFYGTVQEKIVGSGTGSAAVQYTYTPAPVPEPSSMALAVAALVGLVVVGWRSRRCRWLLIGK